MLEKFIKHIEQNQLFEPEQKVLLTVSGGVDSMVLLYLFEQSSFNYAVAHCNFQLRGAESDGDEHFVVDYVSRLGVELHTQHFDTKDFANMNGISIEMAARDLRYNYFNELTRAYSYNYIATAHHQDDQIETFFINLSRKTGIRGLSGIKSKSGNVIRPLLFTNRNEIERFAMENDIPYREDSSNRSTVHNRNFIRHEILPKFDRLNPAFRENVLASIQNMREVEKVYLKAIEQDKIDVCRELEGAVYISITKLFSKDFPKVLLFEILSKYHFNPSVIDEIFAVLNEESGKQFFSSTHRAVKDRNELIITILEKNNISLYYIEQNDLELFNPLHISINELDASNYNISKDQNIAGLDLDKLEFPLIIKKWQQGEYFQPLGMDGFKKLSDFFVDEKMSIPEKENTWILYSGNKVAWIIGKRIDNRFKITDQTKRIYQMEIISNY